MSFLRCENLSKSYGQKVVLNELNLELKSGKIYGLIGRNGAGKTTMLSIMSNQNPSSSGMVVLDGDNIWENRKALDRICFSRELNITAESGLAAYTVKRYVGAAAVYLPHWDKEMAAHLMQTFQLDPKAKLGKLSKGTMKLRALNVGDRITIYLAEDAPVYEMDGCQVICSTLAVEKEL